VSDVPEEVRRLLAERDERRQARDFGAADDLRDRIEALGFRVVDGPGGSSVERAPAAAAERVRPTDVGSVLDLAPRYDATVQWIVEGWRQDVRRGIDSFRATAGARDVQHVVVDVAEGPADAYGAGVEVVPLTPGAGWATARNCGLRRSLGRVVLFVDGSIEATGDVIGPIDAALEDPTVGVCGPFGIVTNDLREFGPGDGPDVDAVEGYLMAFRRDVVADLGGYDERFRWYRSADVELSFRVKDRGLRAVVVRVPVERHEHRMWAAATDEERARWSRRNYNRFLDRFRGRMDLTEAGRAERRARGRSG